MSEESSVTPENSESTPDVPDVEQLRADVEKWKSLSRKNEEKAKSTSKDLKAFEEWKASQLTDTERAIEDAKSSTRAEVVAEYGAKLARTAFLASAKGRLANPDAILARVDAAQFLTEGGEPDETAISEFLDGIAPPVDNNPEPAQQPATGLFQGTRGDTAGSALPLNGDPLLQKVMGIVGAR